MPSAGRDADRRESFVADLDALLEGAGLAPDAPIGIALSGGPDSTALLLLAASGAAGRVRAMTVDHGLRAEAADEARAATGLCARLAIPHEIARVEPGRGSVQAAARAARYEALGAWAAREGLAAVLTAHHADDQAETLLMRLARGAGLAGLSGIREEQRFQRSDQGGASSDDQQLLVLRPLLGWRKAELEAVCADAGIAPVRDPSNHDPRYDRTAARTLLAAVPWFDASRLAASARYLAEAEGALSRIADARYAVSWDGDRAALSPDPEREIARRHVRRLLAEHFDAHPDGRSLDMAVRLLSGGVVTTCADVLCKAEGPLWTFRRAPPRRSV